MPDDGERFWGGRREYERQLARELAAQLGIQEAEALELLGADLNLNNLDEGFWSKHRGAMLLLFMPWMINTFTAANAAGGERFMPLIEPDTQSVLAAASRWAEEHSGNLVAGLDQTSQARLRGLVSQGLDEGWDITRLGRELATHGPFTPTRAELIAQAETTRAQTMGEYEHIQLLESMGVVITKIWRTRPGMSETGPCALCQALEGSVEGDGWRYPFEPPLHPRCVCEVEYIEVAAIE